MVYSIFDTSLFKNVRVFVKIESSSWTLSRSTMFKFGLKQLILHIYKESPHDQWDRFCRDFIQTLKTIEGESRMSDSYIIV